MLRPHPFVLLVIGLPLAPALWGQATPYILFDDPGLPVFDYLVARGEVQDPSFMARPVTVADAVGVLQEADSNQGTPSGRVIRSLLAEWSLPDAKAWWQIEPRGGAQAATHARGDLLHPAGSGTVWPYLYVDFKGVFGDVVLETRPAIETRLSDDPDWTGRKNLTITGRLVAAYLSAQFKWARLFYGDLDRNWAPLGTLGVGLSNYAYPHPVTGLRLFSKKITFESLASQLTDATDPLGTIIQRYYWINRIGARLTPRLSVAFWEETLQAGPAQDFDWRYSNPVSLFLLGNSFGLANNDNLMVGLDAQWRFLGRTTLLAQVGVNGVGSPARYAFTVQLYGPLLSTFAWRAFFTQNSSLVYRAPPPFTTFEDNGIGIGRNFVDNQQVFLGVSMPVGTHWVVGPEFTLLRQGQGSLNTPYPAGSAGGIPALFIGTVENTYQAAASVGGGRGLLNLTGTAAYQHVTNAGHQAGKTDNRFEGRVTATLGITFTGIFK